jgi:hypothetical protein
LVSQSVSRGNKCKQFALDNTSEYSITAEQQIMAEFNGSASKEARILAITRTVLTLVKQNDH